ncbi:MAG: aldose 1-epimerase family protein [Candidatus Ventricola sp.]|nr:aldose 1-epimerase family protein [Candidatus Ventricola sp.]
MLYTIENDRLTVTASSLGAQLWSIRAGDGTEYLWQGDPAYWGDRALTLFPYVARLWQGRYEMDGETHSLPIHGFAPTSEFALAEKTDSRMVLTLASSEETYAQYLRHFVFRVIYALEGSTLKVAYEVENRDERTMYFGLGGHPGFNVPLEKGLRFEDYRLRFGAACRPVRVGFSEDCFVNGEDAPFPLEDGCVLPLAHSLFDDDAIVLRDMAREVTLEAPGGVRSVTVAFPDMPYLGIWHRPKTDAPYVCIEPWRSLPARRGETAVLERQADLVHLAPGETYVNRWRIAIR